MTMCSNIVMFDVMAYVHPLSGIAMLDEDSLQMVDMVCLVLVKRQVFFVKVPPRNAEVSKRTVYVLWLVDCEKLILVCFV